MKCKHCQDSYTLERCNEGHKLVKECLECHLELKHGTIDISTNRSRLGNNESLKAEDCQYLPL